MKTIIQAILLALSPVTLLTWVFYVLPLIATKQFVYVPHRQRHQKMVAPFVWEFVLTDDDTWYTRQWKKWGGWSGPFMFVGVSYARMKKRFPDTHHQTLKKWMKTLKTHELVHNKQQLKFNFVSPGHYFVELISLFIHNLRAKDKDKKHLHLDNKYEREARQVAGQLVDIPRDQWPDGPNDFCPWI